MSIAYLLPARRQMENRMSLAAAGYGLWILLWNILSDHTPIGWTGMTEDTRIWIAVLFICGGAIHWRGVQLNGGYRWSPVWRAAGMTLLTINWFILLFHVPHISSSAFLVYGYFAFRFLQANHSACTDLTHAFKETVQDGTQITT